MVGKSVSHYRILGALGSGGMSIVYKAQDTRLRRYVALKFLREAFCKDRCSVNVFLEEARIAAALNHPGICMIYDTDRSGNRPFIVMEYLQGCTLRDRLKAGRLTIREAVNFMLRITDALNHAHSAGVVHRDISPANLFVTRDRDIKLLDFGIAQRVRRAVRRTTRKSDSGIITGTVHYMSPEQALCQAVDARSDIFSAGVVMYEMLSGHRPFTAPGLAATIDQIINNAPSPLGAVGVPPVLEAILQKCLKKQPALRFQSAAALNAALEAVSSKLDLGVEAHIPRRRSSGLHDEHLDEAGGGMTITMEYPCVAPTLAERR